ncbi:MAG: hypothetical protein SNJ57_09305 [Cyanobacteriota bacterium]
MSNTFVLSHAACYDGLAAAYAAWRQFGDRAQYRFLRYHDPMPQIPDGAEVYILDYWRSPAELRNLLDRGCAVTVLDHHETALIDALRMIGKLRDRQDLFVQGRYVDYAAFNEHQEWRSLNLWSDDDLCTINFQGWTQERLEDFVVALGLRQLYVELLSGKLVINLDLDRSGAAIAWEHFHNDDVPDLIRYVEDRDLWRWKLPDSEAVSEALGVWLSSFRRNRREAGLQAIARQLHEQSPDEPIFTGFSPSDAAGLMSPNLRQICEIELATHLDRQAEAIAEFKALDKLANLPDFAETMAQQGKPLVQPRRDAVAEMCREVHYCEILGFRVPVVPAERYHSWVGSELCRMFPDAPFSMTYRPGGDGVILVDLRSNNGFRVNRVARKLGGGGHAPAAGFTIQQIRTLSQGDRFINAALMDGRPWIIESIMMLNDVEQWELKPPQIWELRPDGRAEEVGDIAPQGSRHRDNVVQVKPDAWVIKLKEDG